MTRESLTTVWIAFYFSPRPFLLWGLRRAQGWAKEFPHSHLIMVETDRAIPNPTGPPAPGSLGSQALLETVSRFYNTLLSLRAGCPRTKAISDSICPSHRCLERPRAQHLDGACCTSSPGLGLGFFFHFV